MGELNFYGIYVPVLLVQACVAYALLQGVMYGIQRLKLDAWMIWPGLFYLFIYIGLLWLVHTVWFM